MNTSRTNPRRPRTPALAPERLEGRELMTGGVGDTFAIIPATITKAGGHAVVSFTLNPKLFTVPNNKSFVLGIDVAANSGSNANPQVLSVTSPTGQTFKAVHATFDPKVTRTGAQSTNPLSSAGLITLPGLPTKTAKSFTYKVNVASIGQTSGSILVGFYLPGDAQGTGTVNQAGINAIKYGLNTNANDTTGKYSFDADVNRNGRIDQTDLMVAQKNFGVGTTVSPVISANLDPNSVSDAANRITHVSTVHITGSATPGAAIVYSEPNTLPVTTVADPTGAYSINLKVNPGANTFSVVATDPFNQKITGSIASITYTPLGSTPTTTTPTTPTATAPTTTTTTTTTTTAAPATGSPTPAQLATIASLGGSTANATMSPAPSPTSGGTAAK